MQKNCHSNKFIKVAMQVATVIMQLSLHEMQIKHDHALSDYSNICNATKHHNKRVAV